MMLPLQGVLLDIEGTTSSVSFVYDVMFPYVRRHLSGYLSDHWEDSAMIPVREQFAQDAGTASWEDWIQQENVAVSDGCLFLQQHVIGLMDGDVKATGLKQLQGMIWKAGFESGQLVADVYDDVPPALHAWQSQGVDVRIYSSGSVQAQKLFFGHTKFGNLLPLLRGHYDTTTGPKREAASYRAIGSDMNTAYGSVLFVSDVVAELDAAQVAGMRTALAVRPGNAPVAAGHGHREISTLETLLVTP
ncbi:MAG: acireductone synthase [Pirellulaceae bacterium]|nr:acireductone synthase [Planctomycetales bacterium]